MLNKYNFLRFLIIVLFLSSIAIATETTWRHSGFEVSQYDINFNQIYNITNLRVLNFGWNSSVPPVSAASKATMYYDDNVKQIKYSVNGGAYQQINDVSTATGVLPNASISASTANLSADNSFTGKIKLISAEPALNLTNTLSASGSTILKEYQDASAFTLSSNIVEPTASTFTTGSTQFAARVGSFIRTQQSSSMDTSSYLDVGFQPAGTNTNSSVAVRITSAGTLSIKTLNATSAFQVGDSGDGTKAWANSWNVYSSKDYKKNIKNASFKTGVVRPISYQQANDDTGEIYYGFPAEELPEGLKVSADGTRFNSITNMTENYTVTGINPVAIIAYQQDVINKLEARVQKLEDRGVLDIMFGKQIDYLYKTFNLTKP